MLGDTPTPEQLQQAGNAIQDAAAKDPRLQAVLTMAEARMRELRENTPDLNNLMLGRPVWSMKNPTMPIYIVAGTLAIAGIMDVIFSERRRRR
jgi:hypothetical protein